MDVLGTIKNAFYVVGSLAGILAWARPAIESKHQEDMKRATAILAKFDEGCVIELPISTYNCRRVPGGHLRPFDEIGHSIGGNRQEVRFIGPLKGALRRELEHMARAYEDYRSYVQVPEWEPVKDADSNEYDWRFNKEAFRRPEGRFTDDYARHLEAAADAAGRVKLRFQRFQALTELHLFEALAPRIFVRRKFKSANLELPKPA